MQNSLKLIAVASPRQTGLEMKRICAWLIVFDFGHICLEMTSSKQSDSIDKVCVALNLRLMLGSKVAAGSFLSE